MNDLRLKQLTLLNYRNIAECTLEFSPKINCFLGNNGMGKTNLLDAIYYLSFCKSSLNSIDSQIIKHHAEFFMLQGHYIRHETEELIACSVQHGRKKQFSRNKKLYPRLIEHIGFVPLVMLAPDDIALIDDGSSERRRFLDMAIAQYSRPYMQALTTYNEVLLQRNALLRSDTEPDITMLDVLEERMSAEATVIFEQRCHFINAFIPVFTQFYEQIADRHEQVTLHYTSHLQQNDLQPLLREVRQRDRIVGYTTRGIHKDEIEIAINEHPIKRTGSQGQNKSVVIAMKLAQLVFLKRACNLTPILLLDDLFDKLDATRVQRIMDIVAGNDFGQIFITDTNREHLDELIHKIDLHANIYNVIEGTVEEAK